MRARKGHITPDKLSFSQFSVSFAKLFHRQVYNQANWQPKLGQNFPTSGTSQEKRKRTRIWGVFHILI